MACLGTGCDAVRASAYSSVQGVPMPVFGVFGYALLALVIFSESLLSGSLAKLVRYAALGMTGFGFLLSLYLDYLQGFVIHAYCAWCLSSGVAMTALFGLAIADVVRSAPEPDAAMQLARVRSLFAVCVAWVLLGVPAFYSLARHYALAPAAPQATATNLAERLVRPGSHAAGNPQAALTVVEFGDFECPVCGRGEGTVRDIRKQYAGQIRFIFRQFPLERIHPFAEKAAEASECAADQGKFWEMEQKIYSRQDDLAIEGLERDAAAIGLDRDRFNQCLTSGAAAARVHQDAEDGRALGVRATPTFFIGQQRIEGVLTAAQFSQLIAGQLATLGVTTAEKVEPAPTPAAAAPKKPTTVAAATSPSTVTPNTAQSIAGNAKSTSTPAKVSPGFPGMIPGGFGAGAQGAGPSGAFGTVLAGETCDEAEAAKKQAAMIDTQELRRLLAGNAKPLFVDVRPANDYAAGRIPGAINLPASEIDARWNTLPKDRTIVLYESGRSSSDICAASRAAGRTLLEHGFPLAQVKVYRDGLAGWERAGLSANQ